MLDNDKCKEILESDGSVYTKEEVTSIITCLMMLSDIMINNIKIFEDEEGSINGKGVE